jgi:hypothetical protein
VCATHRHARRDPVRKRELTPGPPRIHILEDDPHQPGMMKAWKVFAPDTNA